MSYLSCLVEACGSNACASAAVNSVVALSLKAASWGGKRIVALPSADLTGAALSGVTTGVTVVCCVFVMRIDEVKNQLFKCGFSEKALKQIENTVVFATPFFVTILGTPALASLVEHEISYSACALYATLDLICFAANASWQFKV